MQRSKLEPIVQGKHLTAIRNVPTLHNSDRRFSSASMGALVEDPNPRIFASKWDVHVEELFLPIFLRIPLRAKTYQVFGSYTSAALETLAGIESV